MNLDGYIKELVAEEVAKAEARLRIEFEHPRPSPYMTVAEAADFLRCKPQRIYDLRSARKLKAYSDGSRALISREELQRLVTEEQ